jgi:hypothetical protein
MATIPLTSQPSVDDRLPVAPGHAVARAVAIALVVAALALLGVVSLAAKADWWRGYAAATVVSVLGAAASIPVVAWGLRSVLKRPEIVAGTYFASMFARAAIMLGGAVAAILLGGYPKSPTLLMVMPYYLSVLAAETFVVSRLMLKAGQRSLVASASADNATPAENRHV